MGFSVQYVFNLTQKLVNLQLDAVAVTSAGKCGGKVFHFLLAKCFHRRSNKFRASKMRENSGDIGGRGNLASSSEAPCYASKSTEINRD